MCKKLVVDKLDLSFFLKTTLEFLLTNDVLTGSYMYCLTVFNHMPFNSSKTSWLIWEFSRSAWTIVGRNQYTVENLSDSLLVYTANLTV